MPTPPVERQRKYRANLKERGVHRTSVIISEKAHTTLQKIAVEHNVTQSSVIELGILAAAKWLAEGSEDGNDE